MPKQVSDKNKDEMRKEDEVWRVITLIELWIEAVSHSSILKPLEAHNCRGVLESLWKKCYIQSH